MVKGVTEFEVSERGGQGENRLIECASKNKAAEGWREEIDRVVEIISQVEVGERVGKRWDRRVE